MSHFRNQIAMGMLAVAGVTMLAQPNHHGRKVSPDAAGASSGANVAVVIQYTQDPGALK